MKNPFNWVWMMLFMPLFTAAQPLSTTDRFTISHATIQPGGELAAFTVALDGSRLYTAYNMEIRLPDGVEFARDNYGDTVWVSMNNCPIYPYSEDRNGKTYTHSVQSRKQKNGNFRVICVSTINAIFTSTSGDLFNVNVKASPYAKPGMGTIEMFGLNLTTKENAQKYIPEGDLNTGEITIGTEARVPVNISADNKYSTCILPFALASLPEGLQAYSAVDIDSDVLTLQSETSLSAYTPYILYAEAGFSGNLTGTVDAALYPESGKATVNGLTGVLTSQEVSSGYVMQNQGSGVRFHAIEGVPFIIPAGRCYLSVDPAMSQLRIAVSPTSITDVSVSSEAPEVVYDLLGRPVKALRPGHLYISTKRKAFIHK